MCNSDGAHIKFHAHIHLTTLMRNEKRLTYHALYKSITRQNRCAITFCFKKLLRFFGIIVQVIIESLDNVFIIS